MQYYTFQTVNKYKEHFKKIESELEYLRKKVGGKEKYTEEKIEKMLEDNDGWADDKKLGVNEFKKEKEKLQTEYKSLPRFKQVGGKFEEDDVFFEGISKEAKQKKNDKVIEP